MFDLKQVELIEYASRLNDGALYIGKGWVIVCFKKFEKIVLDPSLIAAPYLPQFQIVLSD